MLLSNVPSLFNYHYPCGNASHPCLLQVPAHHALSCKLQAYGTPFAAPDLQATAEQLSDTDLEFAACLASPPDLDERMSFNLGRVMSMLEQNRAQAAGAVGRVAPAHTAAG